MDIMASTLIKYMSQLKPQGYEFHAPIRNSELFHQMTVTFYGVQTTDSIYVRAT